MVDGPTGGPEATSRSPEVGVLEGGFSKLSWRSVFGGTFSALGVWILLGVFGLALGLSMVSPEDPSLRGASIWLGIWSLIVPVLALFLGTLVATRASGGIRRTTGVLYGVVVWGLTTFAATILSLWVMGSVIGQTLQLGTRVVAGVGGAAASVVEGTAGADLGQAAESVGEFLDVDRSEILASLNRELEESGLPPLQPEELRAALQAAVDAALREGSVSAQTFEDALVRETQLSREQVQETARQLEEQWEEAAGAVTGRLENVAEAAGDTALRSLSTLGTMMWWVFGSMAMGLLASIAAGILATTGKMRPTTAERIPITRLEEAHALR